MTDEKKVPKNVPFARAYRHCKNLYDQLWRDIDNLIEQRELFRSKWRELQVENDILRGALANFASIPEVALILKKNAEDEELYIKKFMEEYGLKYDQQTPPAE